MKLAGLLAVAAIAMSAPVAAWAQPQPPAAAQPSARALALSKRYIEVVDMPKLMDSMMASLIPQLTASMASDKDLPPGAADAIASAARASMADIMPKMIDRVTVLYASLFTEDELQALVDFYGGPYGRSIMEKLPKATPAMMAAMSDLIPEMQSHMLQHMCENLHCDAPPPARKTAA